MSSGLIAQWILVCAALAVSCTFVVQRQWPRSVETTRRRLTLWLLRPQRSATLQRLGRRIAPPARVVLPAGTGCGSCGDRKSCNTPVA